MYSFVWIILFDAKEPLRNTVQTMFYCIAECVMNFFCRDITCRAAASAGGEKTTFAEEGIAQLNKVIHNNKVICNNSDIVHCDN